MRALVADDSGPVRALLGGMLTSMGFEVTQVSDGTQAMDRLGAPEPWTLVVLDWNMPGLSGFEVLKQLRAKPDGRKTRVLMVTTETGLDQVTQALEAGASEFLMKPFDWDTLVSKLQIMCLRSEA